MTANSVTFMHLPIWVQVWGLPFDLFSEEVGTDIGKRLGRVVEVDSKVIASNQARFLQILVEIQLDKPIRKGSKVQGLEGDTIWIAFKYERLIGLFFSCGRIGHVVKHCGEPKDADGNGNRYGDWLKGGFWKQNTGESNYQNNPPRSRGLQSRTWEQGPWHLQNQASHRQIRATKTEGAIPKFQGPLWERICHRRESRT